MKNPAVNQNRTIQVQRNLVLLEVRVVTVDLEAAAQMQDLEIMYMDRIPREK